jgi:hypothetical protein
VRDSWKVQHDELRIVPEFPLLATLEVALGQAERAILSARGHLFVDDEHQPDGKPGRSYHLTVAVLHATSVLRRLLRAYRTSRVREENKSRDNIPF